MRLNLDLNHKASDGMYKLISSVLRKKPWMLCLTIFFVTLTGCATLNPTIPLKIPIDLSKAGSVAEAEFWIPQNDRLQFYLYFLIDKPDDAKKLWEILTPHVNWGRGIEPIVIPLKIQITKRTSKESYEIWMEKTYLSDRYGSASSEAIDRWIESENIKSGSYRIRIENIQSFPVFAQHRVEFRIYYVPAYLF